MQHVIMYTVNVLHYDLQKLNLHENDGLLAIRKNKTKVPCKIKYFYGLPFIPNDAVIVLELWTDAIPITLLSSNV